MPRAPARCCQGGRGESSGSRRPCTRTEHACGGRYAEDHGIPLPVLRMWQAIA